MSEKVRLTLWVTPEAKERIKDNAARAGVSASAYVSVLASLDEAEMVENRIARRFACVVAKLTSPEAKIVDEARIREFMEEMKG